MKILELHKLKPKPKIQTCPRCRTKFEYDKQDIQYAPVMSSLGDIYHTYLVVCPSCARGIKVEEDDE